MIPRILEPEVMDTTAEAQDYNSMDHGDVNRRFVDDFLSAVARSEIAKQLADSGDPAQFLDVGTGTALIPIELCGRELNCRVVGIDLAEEMLKVGRQNVEQAKLESAVSLEQIDAKKMPYGDGEFDAVISNSIVHHIPEPMGVFREMVRVVRPGGNLFVRDLLRPDSLDELERLVGLYAGEENEHQQQMFRESLHAALTLKEVQLLLSEVGLAAECAKQTSDRHWTVIV